MSLTFNFSSIVRVLMYCFFGYTGIRGIYKMIALDFSETISLDRFDYFVGSIISTLVILLLMGKI